MENLTELAIKEAKTIDGVSSLLNGPLSLSAESINDYLANIDKMIYIIQIHPR